MIQVESSKTGEVRGVERFASGAHPKVVFVIPGAAEGHSMVFARRQAEACRAQGIEVHEFYLASRTAPWALLAEWIRFRRECKRIRPSVIHAQYGSVTALFAALAAGRSIPLVITYRGSDLNPLPTDRSLRAWVARLASQLAGECASRIICVSEALAEQLWWAKERAEVLPTGVDTDEFCPGSREEARQRLGWPEAQKIVLFVLGSGGANKRRDLADAAIVELQRRMPEVMLRIAEGQVSPSQMPDWMRAADCLLLTSDREGSPTVIQEALATNLPIVSVDVGDVAERLQGVRSTAVVERDPEKIAAALEEMIETPRRTDGRKKIDEFSSSMIAAQLAELYRRLTVPPTADARSADRSDAPVLDAEARRR